MIDILINKEKTAFGYVITDSNGNKEAIPCICIKDEDARKIVEEIERLQTNEMMASGCLNEVKETLDNLPCMHKDGNHEATPAMFYRELILCCISRARTQGINAGLKYAEKTFTWDEHDEDGKAKAIWNQYVSDGYYGQQ